MALQLVKGLPQGSVVQMLEYICKDYDMSDSRQSENYNVIEKVVSTIVKKHQLSAITDWSPILQLPAICAKKAIHPFPKAYVSDSLLSAATAIATFNMCSVDDALMVLIGAISACINRKAQIEVGTDDIVTYFHLAMLFIADSGTFKSTIYKQSTQGLVKGEAEAFKAYKKQKYKVDAELTFLTREQTSLTKAPTKNSPEVTLKECLNSVNRVAEIQKEIDERKQLRSPQTMVDDVTQEKAAEVCYAAGGRLSVFAPEAQSFIANNSDQYGKGTAKTDLIVRGFSHDTYDYKRKGNEVDVKMAVVANACIWGQLDIIWPFLQDKRVCSSGLYARLIAIMLQTEKAVKTKETLKLDKEKVQEFTDRTAHLARYMPENSEFVYQIEEDPDPILMQPVTCIKAYHVEQRYINMFNELFASFEPGGDNEGKRGEFNKVLTTAYTIASCLYAYDNYSTFFINKEHEQDSNFIDAVYEIMKYLIALRKSVVESREEQATLDRAKDILSFLKKSSILAEFKLGLPPAKFNNKLKTYGGNSSDVVEMETYTDALELLQDHNYIKYQADPVTKKWLVYVNPDIKPSMKLNGK